MRAYGQFCPVAKAMELLDERWTMLVVRELLAGSRHFNDLRRGLPRMSPALLAKRLRKLVAAGVVERHDSGSRVSYTLTPAGEELAPIVDALGRWGIRWVPVLGDEDLDPHLLLWDIHRHVDHEAVPDARTVLRFSFPDVPGPASVWWIVITPEEAEVCDFDPGYDVAATVEADLRALTEVWRGDVSWAGALRSGRLRIHGPAHVRRAVPAWLKLPTVAGVPRPVSR